jgi:zinc protease
MPPVATTGIRTASATASTFAALPRRVEPRPVPATQRAVGFPKGDGSVVELTHKGRADQAVGYIAWPTSDYWADPQRARDTAVLREIMNLRLTDELRENQGATYSPSVGSQHSLVWPGWGYIAATVEVPPEKLQGFFNDTLKIAAKLAEDGVSADELARAKAPRIEALQKAQLTNGYWLGELSGAQTDPRRLDVIRQLITGTEQITAADVQRAAQTWFRPGRDYRVEIKPAARVNGAPASPTPSQTPRAD